MRKISLYRFVTTFCLVPVTDWGAFTQLVVAAILKCWLFTRLLGLLRTPFFIAGMIAVLTYAPNAVMWIFLTIGDIELKICGMVLAAIMPDIFKTADGSYASWADIYREGMNVLPADLVDVMNGLGVAEMMGLITATFGAVGSIRLYRRIMLRAGLL